ncbi:UNVERIFIED_CONTAM: hypothetical protein HDU68_003607, partial [Siphonaria sp. JEL0065]
LHSSKPNKKNLSNAQFAMKLQPNSGLLGCAHVFCSDCAKKWRLNNTEDLARNKECAVCRSPSRLLVPSKVFPKSPAEKEGIIAAFRAEKAAIPCRYFKRGGGLKNKRCPFGDECIYGHMDASGKRVTGVRKPASRRSSGMDVDDGFDGANSRTAGFMRGAEDTMHQLFNSISSLGLPPNSTEADIHVALNFLTEMRPELVERVRRMVMSISGGPMGMGMMPGMPGSEYDFDDDHDFDYEMHDHLLQVHGGLFGDGYDDDGNEGDDDDDMYYTTDDEEVNEYDTVD